MWQFSFAVIVTTFHTAMLVCGAVLADAASIESKRAWDRDCTTKVCANGQVCQMVKVHCVISPCTPQEPVCVDATATDAKDISNAASIDSKRAWDRDCTTKVCANGQVCQMVKVHCVISPCTPQEPVCVDPPPSDARHIPSCTDVTCTSDETCELQVVMCFTTPCDPMPTCVAKAKSSCMLNGEELCMNGGSCLHQFGQGGYCRCPDGYYGDRCEKHRGQITG